MTKYMVVHEENLVTLHSDSELYIFWWIKELYDKGYILKFDYEPTAFILTEGVTITKGYTKVYKSKHRNNLVVDVSRKIIPRREYTVDFKIYWNNIAENLFFISEVHSLLGDKIDINLPVAQWNNTEECYVTYFEVKPDSFDYQNMTRLAKNNIAAVYERHKIIIELVKPSALFKKTFTPKRFLTTNKEGSTTFRKIKGEFVHTYALLINKYVTLKQTKNE